jgi:iron(III) transport system substrate-binding protein
MHALPRWVLALAAAAAAGIAWAQAEAPDPELARKEGTVTLYTSMQLVDSRPLTEAFEKRYGVKVNLWRASGEKVAQRVLTEARGGRFEADVVETDGAQMEILHREKRLAPLLVPAMDDIPAEIIPAHRSYAPTRLSLYVLAFNTQRIPASEAPRSYADLLDPKWAGRFAIEADDVAWFAAVTRAMGEKEGLAYFGRLAAMKPQVRKGHTLMAELVAAGDVDMALDAHVQGVARLKDKGAPIDWRPLDPAFGQPSSVGVTRQAPHPHAAALFAQFILSREGQEAIKARNRVPSSRAVDSPLNKFRYQLIDPAIMLDDWERYGKQFSDLFLGGKPVAKD